jgi:hypothetical protein
MGVAKASPKRSVECTQCACRCTEQDYWWNRPALPEDANPWQDLITHLVSCPWGTAGEEKSLSAIIDHKDSKRPRSKLAEGDDEESVVNMDTSAEEAETAIGEVDTVANMEKVGMRQLQGPCDWPKQ